MDQAIADTFIVLGIIGYWVPSIVAAIRRVPNAGSVIVVDLFTGWTVVGWVVAMAMACRSKPQPQQPPAYGWHGGDYGQYGRPE